MKNLKQIKNDYAIQQGFANWYELITYCNEKYLDYYITEVIILVQKECLKRASENAYLNGSEYSRCGCEINKESITNENNIVK